MKATPKGANNLQSYKKKMVLVKKDRDGSRLAFPEEVVPIFRVLLVNIDNTFIIYKNDLERGGGERRRNLCRQADKESFLLDPVLNFTFSTE